jgi:tetratricopeptide (TPR) repeat protein
MRLAMIVLFVFAALPLGSFAQASGFDQAKALIADKKFSEASAVLDTWIAAHPNDAAAFVLRGDAEFERGRPDLALVDYDKAIGLGEAGAYVFAARCDSERVTEEPVRAAADCAKALKLDPSNRRALWARGRLALENRRYADAIADLSAYLAQNSSALDTAYYFRGLAYNHEKNYKLAFADLQVYVGRAATDPDGYRERAVARYGLGNAADAKADLEIALAGYDNAGDGSNAQRIRAMLRALKAGEPLH